MTSFHDRFADQLLQMKKEGQLSEVWLVSRLYDQWSLKGASTEPSVFIPDLHLMTADSRVMFKYHFDLVSDGRAVERSVLLPALLHRLSLLRQPPTGASFRVIQLGDYLDIWREPPQKRKHMKQLVNRMKKDNLAVVNGLAACAADVVAGNHDVALRKNGLGEHKTSIPLGNGPDNQLLALHGDMFDRYLTWLPDDWEMAALNSRFARGVRATTYELDRSDESGFKRSKRTNPEQNPGPVLVKKLQDLQGLPETVNVWKVKFNNEYEYPDPALSDAHELAYYASLMMVPLGLGVAVDGRGDRLKYGGFKPGVSHFPNLRGFVVGHSHKPRIVVHEKYDGGKFDEVRSFALFDCGAWLEECQLGPKLKPVPSCHVGVLADSDFRIYQLTPAGFQS